MNKTLLTAALAGLTCVVALGQGSFSFSSAAGSRPRILGLDGQNTGANINVEVLAWNPGTSGYESLATTPALTAPAILLGTFSGGAVEVPFAGPGTTAELLIRAWDTTTGATYADAAANPAGIIGSSGAFDVANLGGTVTPGEPPNLPAAIVFDGGGYQGIQLELVPEPSTYALAALGLGGLLFFRRKK